MPVTSLLPRSIRTLPAPTLTDPALPDEKVPEEIWPPLKIERLPPVATSTLPALPVLPRAAWLEVPVKNGLFCPSMNILPAETFTEPASPGENVVEEIAPPFRMEMPPVEVTVALP